MNRKGQNAIEFALILVMIAAALIGMQAYLKRGIQGKIKASSEQVGGELGYSPGATVSDSNIGRTINESTNSYKQNISGTEYSVFDSSTNLSQSTNRNENLLSIGEEPVR